MSATTGPIAAAVVIVVGNAVVVQNKELRDQSRVIVGGLIAGIGLNLWERVMPATATVFAWLALTTVLLVRVDDRIPSPIESFQTWYNAK